MINFLDVKRSVIRKILILFLIILFSFTQNFSQSLFVNQAGYLPEGNKRFYTDIQASSFKVCRSDNDDEVYEGNFILTIENDAATGSTILQGDFSDFKSEGIFYIKVNDSLKSDIFNISPDVYEDVLFKSLKSYYFQRCGIALTENYAGIYKHPACHLNDGTYHTTAGKTGTKTTTGGWHDAGDFGKYVVNSNISLGTLLMAYELFPALFKMDNLNIPESGNGIPDILDESKFQLEWMLSMQNDDGGLFHKITAANFPGYIMPQNDNVTRYIYQVSSTATAGFAAVMAKSYRIFKDYDSTFAQLCLEAAEKSAQFLESNPSIVPAGGFRNPSGTNSGQYGDGYDGDERIWAYAELYLSTNNENYLTKYLNISQTPFNNEMAWPSVAQMGNISLLFLDEEENNNQKENLKNSLINYCTNLFNYISWDGFNTAIKPGEYVWGSNSNILNNAILFILAYEVSGNEDFLKAAQFQFNYMLGANIHNISFITGVGARYPKRIHHRPSAADNITEPVPGLIAGGPNEGLQDPVLQANFDDDTPPARCYIDHLDSYASNEICINWNAPLVFVAGYLNSKEYLLGFNNHNKVIPAGFDLRQNYPNPFNGQTKIEYNLPANGFVTLKIYNLLGELLLNKDFGYMPAGENFFLLNNDTNNFFCSGIYFYELKYREYSLIKKMVYLK